MNNFPLSVMILSINKLICLHRKLGVDEAIIDFDAPENRRMLRVGAEIYVSTSELPKKFGRFVLFIVRRSGLSQAIWVVPRINPSHDYLGVDFFIFESEENV